jgi:type II secretory pathway predicted ATPase ExeA
MYESFFHFKASPFTAAPIIETYFPGEAIEQARQTSARAIERADGPVLVVGPAGVGKTMLCRLLAAHFDLAFHVVLLSNTQVCTRKSLLQHILFELGLPYRDLDEGELRLSLIDHLHPNNSDRQGMLLIIDEAHTLPLRLLEEVRMITNLVRDGQPRVRLVLVGNARLEERFAHPKLDSFNQRVAARCYLQSLHRDDMDNYVRSQVAAAGGEAGRVFTDDAFRALYQATDGIPRLVNQVCNHALTLACQAGRHRIDAAQIEESWADLQQLPTPWNEVGVRADGGQAVIEFGELEPMQDEPGLDSEDPVTTSDDLAAESRVEQAAESISVITEEVVPEDDSDALVEIADYDETLVLGEMDVVAEIDRSEEVPSDVQPTSDGSSEDAAAQSVDEPSERTEDLLGQSPEECSCEDVSVAIGSDSDDASGLDVEFSDDTLVGASLASDDDEPASPALEEPPTVDEPAESPAADLGTSSFDAAAQLAVNPFETQFDEEELIVDHFATLAAGVKLDETPDEVVAEPQDEICEQVESEMPEAAIESEPAPSQPLDEPCCGAQADCERSSDTPCTHDDATILDQELEVEVTPESIAEALRIDLQREPTQEIVDEQPELETESANEFEGDEQPMLPEPTEDIDETAVAGDLPSFECSVFEASSQQDLDYDTSGILPPQVELNYGDVDDGAPCVSFPETVPVPNDDSDLIEVADEEPVAPPLADAEENPKRAQRVEYRDLFTQLRRGD